MAGDAHTNPTSPSAAPSIDDHGLDERKALILRTVVAEHIATGQPIGSQHITSSGGLRVSSATIRNEMSLLEREGYLTHPHTSAGRVPTDRGYRYFVDSLGDTPRLSDAKFTQVQQFFDSARADMEQLLTDATRLLSSLTDFAAVAVASPVEAVSVRSVHLVGLGTTALAVMVLSNGAVEKALLELEAGVSDNQVNAASAHLSATLRDIPVTLLATANVLAIGDATVDALCASALKALAPTTKDAEGAEVFVGGTSRVVGSFDRVDTVQRILATLEEHYTVVNLLSEVLHRFDTGVADRGPAGVSIGTEHGADAKFASLLSCSVVVAPFRVEGRAVGTLAVLGPTRMDYPQAMAAVTAVGERLGERLHDG